MEERIHGERQRWRVTGSKTPRTGNPCRTARTWGEVHLLAHVRSVFGDCQISERNLQRSFTFGSI